MLSTVHGPCALVLLVKNFPAAFASTEDVLPCAELERSGLREKIPADTITSSTILINVAFNLRAIMLSVHDIQRRMVIVYLLPL